MKRPKSDIKTGRMGPLIDKMMNKILILPGDGIGPEVMGEVRRIIDWFGTQTRLSSDAG